MDQVAALEHLLATALRRIAELEAALASMAQENVDLDLSRFSAAPSARLSHLWFESDGAFPAQC
jgi:regulator of replication initiation timing